MRIDFKSLTGPQVALLLGSAVIVAACYKVFGDKTAGLVAVVAAILNAMGGPKGGTPASGDSAAPPAPPVVAPPAALFGLLAFALVACGAVAAPDPNVLTYKGFQIGTCQAEARIAKAQDAGADAAWGVYDSCMRDYGFRGVDGGAK